MNSEQDLASESDRLAEAPHPRVTRQFFGNADAETALLDAYRTGRLPHAWLIGGPQGIGKATLAWRFARFLAANPDPSSEAVAQAWTLAVPEHDPATRRIAGGAIGDVALLRREINDKTGKFFTEIRVDEVRRAMQLFQRAARAGGYRICIIDSAEDLNRNSANALLKLIEEPPALSLFLVIAHRPSQLMPTLRSRCRALIMKPPAAAETIDAIRALGAPWSQTPEATLAEAVARGDHSVRGALHWLGKDRLSFEREILGLLDRLPLIDWSGVHRIADRIGSDDEAFETLLESLLAWLHGRLHAAAAEAPAPGQALSIRRLAPLAEVWDKIRHSAREAQALNLDKRSFLFSTFSDLARAIRTS